MPAPKVGQVEFSALVPADEYEKFKNNFPAYGAVKWFINESLHAFNQKVQEHPSLRDLVDTAVSEMLGGS